MRGIKKLSNVLPDLVRLGHLGLSLGHQARSTDSGYKNKNIGFYPK